MPRDATNTNHGYTGAPDQDQREREDQPDFRRDVFLQVSLVRPRIGDTRRTHMSAGIETLCAIASVEEERFVLLDLGELISQALDLRTRFQPDPGDILRWRTCLGWRYQRWKSCDFGQHPNGTRSASVQRSRNETADFRRCSSSAYLTSLKPTLNEARISEPNERTDLGCWLRPPRRGRPVHTDSVVGGIGEEWSQRVDPLIVSLQRLPSECLISVLR